MKAIKASVGAHLVGTTRIERSVVSVAVTTPLLAADRGGCRPSGTISSSRRATTSKLELDPQPVQFRSGDHALGRTQHNQNAAEQSSQDGWHQVSSGG
uniref:Uncharacterized protein n=1 Tax=Rhodopseudomonas palustris (strain ATCC BAA-98 / CGA009) TaxID=258594 RepID=Q6N5G9_RHOPA|nr:hypothetical protein RPA3005 [Rhodopseudomonas palustris CGA009]